MKIKVRYASIDFLRGIAIFLMYILLIINNLLDFDLFFHEDNIAGMPVGIIVILIECGILGGLAGLLDIKDVVVTISLRFLPDHSFHDQLLQTL